MNRAAVVLEDHPVNRARIAAGKKPANADLALGPGSGAEPAEVRRRPWPEGGDHLGRRPGPGRGRARRLDSHRRPRRDRLPRHRLRGQGRGGRSRPWPTYDIVCVHVEAPDEASHEGRPDAKVEAIERIDRDIVGPVRRALEVHDRWRMVISPDHSTLLRTRAHDRAPVAWAMAGTGLPASGRTYDEASAREAGGPSFDQGYRLMGHFLDLGWNGRL